MGTEEEEGMMDILILAQICSSLNQNFNSGRLNLASFANSGEQDPPLVEIRGRSLSGAEVWWQWLR